MELMKTRQQPAAAVSMFDFNTVESEEQNKTTK